LPTGIEEDFRAGTDTFHHSPPQEAVE